METVETYLRKHESRFIDELCEYVRFPSVSAQPKHRQDLANCADWLVKHCQQIGLDTERVPTDGNPVILARTPRRRHKNRPHFLIYGHYDVQPPEPFELWTYSPFEPTRDGNVIYGRGISDNKGQHFAHLKAVEAYLKTDTELPCDLTFLIEGEEEVGSRHLTQFLKTHRSRLKGDALIISDNAIPGLKHPALTYGLRGVAALNVQLNGPARDLHSGIYGGSVDNPAMVLCQMLGQLRSKNGRINIPNFYREVAPLTRYEREQLSNVPFDERHYKKFLGVPELFGEKGYSPVEQRSVRPTLEINGLTSGYQGEGSKTIIPSSASAKLTFRLVPNQKPKAIMDLVKNHLKHLCPPTVRLSVEYGHGGEPYIVSPQKPLAKAALSALKQAYGYDPILMREGGSIPIVNEFKKVLNVDTFLLGLALPDDNPHSPNERFHLDAFKKGMRLSAGLWPELASV